MRFLKFLPLILCGFLYAQEEVVQSVYFEFDKFNLEEKQEKAVVDYIQKTVSDYFQLDLEMLQSKTRKRHVVQARQLAMFFAKKFTKASLANIGSQIGDRDHATVLHACKTVDNLVSTDKQFKKYVEDIHKKLSL